MATSTSDDAYVWVWLPQASDPVPAGRLRRRGAGLWFDYGRRYLERPNAISLSPTMPLRTESFGPDADLGMPGALRDGSPDAWGRRVILNARTGRRGWMADTAELAEITYLLESGSNRLGAIDFQESPAAYVPRSDTASLDELARAAEIVEDGGELPAQLAAALVDGTTLGGARPKALIARDGVEYLAKFSTSHDTIPVVGAEAVSLALARRAGVDTVESEVVSSLGRDVLLVRRFDRPGGGTRVPVVSALTLSRLGEMTSRYGSYPGLLAAVRETGTDAGAEIFRRIAVNIAISNTDDHLRNHAAFWDGVRLTLTPAYDLSPASRTGETASQAIAFSHDGRRESNLAVLVSCASEYGLTRRRALDTVDEVITAILDGWQDAADAARLTTAQRDFLFGRQFLNPGALRGLPNRAAS